MKFWPISKAQATLPLTWQVACSTDTGCVRSCNEDRFACLRLRKKSRQYVLAMVADGMGGHGHGDTAAELVTSNIVEYFTTKLKLRNPGKELETAIRRANDSVVLEQQKSESRKAMGSTCTALLIEKNTAYIAQVGDSRLYLHRAGQIKQVTKDQTYVQTLIDAGKLSQEEAFSHPDRNIILQAIGGHHRQLSPAMHRIKLEPNDQILLCSDGLYEYLTDVEIAKILAEHTPTEAVEEMVNRAKARGGHDNITLIVLTAGSRTTPSQPLSFTQEITTS